MLVENVRELTVPDDVGRRAARDPSGPKVVVRHSKSCKMQLWGAAGAGWSAQAAWRAHDALCDCVERAVPSRTRDRDQKCGTNARPCSLPMLFAHALCPCSLPMLFAHARCPCSLPMLVAHARCPCSLPMLFGSALYHSSPKRQRGTQAEPPNAPPPTPPAILSPRGSVSMPNVKSVADLSPPDPSFLVPKLCLAPKTDGHSR